MRLELCDVTRWPNACLTDRSGINIRLGSDRRVVTPSEVLYIQPVAFFASKLCHATSQHSLELDFALTDLAISISGLRGAVPFRPDLSDP